MEHVSIKRVKRADYDILSSLETARDNRNFSLYRLIKNEPSMNLLILFMLLLLFHSSISPLLIKIYGFEKILSNKKPKNLSLIMIRKNVAGTVSEILGDLSPFSQRGVIYEFTVIFAVCRITSAFHFFIDLNETSNFSRKKIESNLLRTP